MGEIAALGGPLVGLRRLVPARDRVLGGVLASPSLVVLALAHHLTPSPSGYGTHLQLGLRPCTFLTLTGWPCPMCGMTTTFAWLAHGHPVEALRTQPFGLVLFPMTVAASVVGLVDLVTGRGLARTMFRRLEPCEGRLATAFLLAMLLGWAYKCTVFHPEILPWAP